ncbi:MAG: hypothetical protein FJZ01_26360 [Candidatus Sericytochromatia bacterium]|nr:hypothetical protein [Candidatus Tanganyikabacteria bacterium]
MLAVTIRLRAAMSCLVGVGIAVAANEAVAASYFASVWSQSTRWVGVTFRFARPYTTYQSHCTQGTGVPCGLKTPDDAVFRYFAANVPAAGGGGGGGGGGGSPPYATYYSYRFGLVSGTFGGSDPFVPAATTSTSWRLAAQVVACGGGMTVPAGAPSGQGCSILSEYQSTASLPAYPITLRLECTTDPYASQGSAMCGSGWHGLTYIRMSVDGLDQGAAQFMFSNNTGSPGADWSFAQVSSGVYTSPFKGGDFPSIQEFRTVLGSSQQVPAHPSTLTDGRVYCVSGCSGPGSYRYLINSQVGGLNTASQSVSEGTSFVATGDTPGAYLPAAHRGDYSYISVDTPAF